MMSTLGRCPARRAVMHGLPREGVPVLPGRRFPVEAFPGRYLSAKVSTMSARRVRIGIDTGGTFTDVVAVDEETGQMATTKTPSTPADPAEGFLTGVRKVLGPARPGRQRGHRGQPRDDGRDQPAARGQAGPDRVHHHRGLRVGAGDRPAVGARRLRQQLLLGQAAADRAGRPGAHRPAAGWTSAAPRSGRSTGTTPSPPPGSSRTPASPRSASASCTPTRTTPTSRRCSTCIHVEHPEAVRQHRPARCCASTASTSAR